MQVFATQMEETFKSFDGKPLTQNIDNSAIRNATLNELKQEIKKLRPKKAPGYDLITGEVLKELPRKALIKLLFIINAAFRLEYAPSQWKVAEVMMVLKPGKPPNEKTSYRPILLIPILSKVFERVLRRQIQPVIKEKRLIPDHQLGLRSNYSTVDQVHRITDVIEKSLEGKMICSNVFLDISHLYI